VLILARHGATDLNEAGRVQGRADVGLTRRGREQAESLGSWIQANFSVSHVYSSPARRALETAAPIVRSSSDVPIETSEWLVERNYGSFEDLDEKELLASRLAAGLSLEDPRQNWDGAVGVESDFVVWQRFRQFCEAQGVERVCRDHDILVVTHAGLIKSVFCQGLGISPGRPYPILLGPGSALVLSVPDGVFQLAELWRNSR
jgi:broad specificity phosphatase PhoE